MMKSGDGGRSLTSGSGGVLILVETLKSVLDDLG